TRIKAGTTRCTATPAVHPAATCSLPMAPPTPRKPLLCLGHDLRGATGPMPLSKPCESTYRTPSKTKDYSQTGFRYHEHENMRFEEARCSSCILAPTTVQLLGQRDDQRRSKRAMVSNKSRVLENRAGHDASGSELICSADAV